ncbi:MAG: ferrous iron transport protein B [bacterium]
MKKILVACAGQPNSGKSTIFNLLTGARQHVANYPGVTIEKKTGEYRFGQDRIEIVDLPGTYSLTSYSLEERVARDFLLHEAPDLIVDVVDASNLERSLYLVFQLAEMGIPLVIDLNMMDVVERRGFKINVRRLSERIGATVVSTVGNRGKGKKPLKEAIYTSAKEKKSSILLNYGELEPGIAQIESQLQKDSGIKESRYPTRWLAVKLVEGDSEAKKVVSEHAKHADTILMRIEDERKQFVSYHKKEPEKAIAQIRYQKAEEIVADCITYEGVSERRLTDRIDQIVCNRFLGPIILAATIYLLYELAIVKGYELTNYTWPLLAYFRDLIASALPYEGFVFDPFLRSMPLGVFDGIIAVLNYIPIFLILFALIAILEDTGYIARMAFILDRIFRNFGLHGQSILPLVLGGLYVGGCAIPGCMACRGIKDERARLATILVVPLMNCLAKIPLYVLLIGIFFAGQKGLYMFLIATITIIIALSVAKLLSLTILRKKETAPFVLEMPTYHLPTIGNVLRRSVERTWLFVRKVMTIVIAVMVLVYLLVSFPSLNPERKADYTNQANQLIASFFDEIGRDNPYARVLAGHGLMEFVRYLGDYKKAKIAAKGKMEKVNQSFLEKNPEFAKIVNKGKIKITNPERFKAWFFAYKKDKERFLATYARLSKENRKRLKVAFYQKWDRINHKYFSLVRTGDVILEKDELIDSEAKMVYKAYGKLEKERKALRGERKEEVIASSYLGRAGKFIEPVTKFAGFNWRVNIALLSSFAAKESSVATLGSIYEPAPEARRERLEERIKEKEKGWTPLHAASLMFFMAMYPPCIPTLIMIKLEAGMSWMLFAAIYPVILGFIIAVILFSGGTLLGLSGLQASIYFYILAIAVMVVMGFIKRKPMG